MFASGCYALWGGVAWRDKYHAAPPPLRFGCFRRGMGFSCAYLILWRSSGCQPPSVALCFCPGAESLERVFGGMSRFQRLARDQERLAEVLRGFHMIAFSMLMWTHLLPILGVL